MKINQKDKYDMIEQHSLSQSIARVFEEAEKEYFIIDFSLIFINTELFTKYFTDYTIFSQSRKYILQLFYEEISSKNISLMNITEPQYDGDVAYWLGYLLAEWKQEYIMDMSLIAKEHLKWLYDNYDVLHTQSVKYVYQEFVTEILCKEKE